MARADILRSIFIETSNDIGITSDVADLLAERANVNIKSMWGGIWEEKGRFCIITDNNAKAISALDKSEFDVLGEQEVVVVGVPNKQGIISSITNLISNASININYLYTTIFENKPALIFSTDNNQKVSKLFN